MDPTILKTMRKNPGLDDGEAAEMAAKAQAGDVEVRNELVLHHLRMITYMAKIFARRDHTLFEELFQHGSIILMDCIERFEPEREIPFRTWAAQQLRFHFWKYIVRMHRTTAALQDYAEKIYHENITVPSPEEDDASYKYLADTCLYAEKHRWITRHQSEIFLMRARGLTDKQISEKLGGIHRNTIFRNFKRVVTVLQEIRPC